MATKVSKPGETTVSLTLRVPTSVSNEYAQIAKVTGVTKSRLAADALEAQLGMLRAGWIMVPDPRLRVLTERSA